MCYTTVLKIILLKPSVYVCYKNKQKQRLFVIIFYSAIVSTDETESVSNKAQFSIILLYVTNIIEKCEKSLRIPSDVNYDRHANVVGNLYSTYVTQHFS